MPIPRNQACPELAIIGEILRLRGYKVGIEKGWGKNDTKASLAFTTIPEGLTFHIGETAERDNILCWVNFTKNDMESVKGLTIGACEAGVNAARDIVEAFMYAFDVREQDAQSGPILEFRYKIFDADERTDVMLPETLQAMFRQALVPECESSQK